MWRCENVRMMPAMELSHLPHFHIYHIYHIITLSHYHIYTLLISYGNYKQPVN